MKTINTTEKIYLTEDFFKKECLRSFDDIKEFHSYLSKNVKVWSWGANNYCVVENTILRFKVQARRFKGLIWIAPNGSDLFNIYYSKARRSENGCYELVEKVYDIYLEDVINIIDEKIEKIEIYK